MMKISSRRKQGEGKLKEVEYNIECLLYEYLQQSSRHLVSITECDLTRYTKDLPTTTSTESSKPIHRGVWDKHNLDKDRPVDDSRDNQQV